MLAISVREALRDAIRAFASPGHRATTFVDLDSPATPERVYFAVYRMRNCT
jgi:xanthine dehydrogenase large subunit